MLARQRDTSPSSPRTENAFAKLRALLRKVAARTIGSSSYEALLRT
jgi:hypothetical protein